MKKEAVLAPNELIRDRTSGRITTGTLRKSTGKKFQQYFQRDGKVVGFKYGGTSYQILIHEVKCMCRPMLHIVCWQQDVI